MVNFPCGVKRVMERWCEDLLLSQRERIGGSKGLIRGRVWGEALRVLEKKNVVGIAAM